MENELFDLFIIISGETTREKLGSCQVDFKKRKSKNG